MCGLKISDNGTTTLLKSFWNLHRNAFWLFVFSKLKRYEILAFNDTLEMCCCALHYWKLKLYKQALSKIRAVKYSVSFFSRIYLLFSRGFCQKCYEKIVLFCCKFSKLISTSTTRQNFKILIFLLLKLRRLTYNAEFENSRFFIGLLAEGTTSTWWILLHNDRNRRHQRIKKQRRHERLAVTQASYPCGW